MTSVSFTVKELKERLEDGELDLSLSTLTEDDLPVKAMKQLKKFSGLDLSCNVMTCIPTELCSFTQLIKLDVSKNLLTHLPDNIGQLVNLQSLDIVGNKLSTLPESFGSLRSLHWLDIRDNPLSATIKKEAGDCLDDKQCKTCALRVVKLMNYVHVEREKIRTEEKANLEAEAQRVAEEEKEEKKRLKQAEKERRRLEYLNQKKTELENDQTTPSSTGEGDAQESGVADSKGQGQSHTGSACGAVFVWFAVLLALAGVLYYYVTEVKGDDPTHFIHTSLRLTVEYLNNTIMPVLERARDKIYSVIDSAKGQ